MSLCFREDKILEQTSSLQRIIEGKEITICELQKKKKEGLTAFQCEIDRSNEVETQLRMQIQKLKSAVKDMKLQMMEMTSEEEERLNKKQLELNQKEQLLIKERRQFMESKNLVEHNTISEKDVSKYDMTKLYLELKKAIEEIHILKEEKSQLLERCNKLQASIRRQKKNNISDTNFTTSKDSQNYNKIEDLQYDLTKHQLGLIALRRPYKTVDYTDDEEISEPTRDVPDENESFLDSEISSFRSFVPSIEPSCDNPDLPVGKRPKSKQKQRPRLPINFNKLRPQS